MKSILLLSYLILASFSMHAYNGDPYLFKIKVTHDKGTTIGFWQAYDLFEIGSVSDVEFKEYVENDSVFTSLVKEYISDSLYLYKKVYSIDSLDLTILFSDQKFSISENEVKVIEFISVKKDGYVGREVNSQHTSYDLKWLKKKYKSTEIIGAGVCNYNLYFFENVHADPDVKEGRKKFEEANEHLDEISEGQEEQTEPDPNSNEEESIELILKEYLDLMKGKKVLIVSECAC